MQPVVTKEPLPKDDVVNADEKQESIPEAANGITASLTRDKRLPDELDTFPEWNRLKYVIALPLIAIFGIASTWSSNPPVSSGNLAYQAFLSYFCIAGVIFIPAILALSPTYQQDLGDKGDLMMGLVLTFAVLCGSGALAGVVSAWFASLFVSVMDGLFAWFFCCFVCGLPSGIGVILFLSYAENRIRIPGAFAVTIYCVSFVAIIVAPLASWLLHKPPDPMSLLTAEQTEPLRQIREMLVDEDATPYGWRFEGFIEQLDNNDVKIRRKAAEAIIEPLRWHTRMNHAPGASERIGVLREQLANNPRIRLAAAHDNDNYVRFFLKEFIFDLVDQEVALNNRPRIQVRHPELARRLQQQRMPGRLDKKYVIVEMNQPYDLVIQWDSVRDVSGSVFTNLTIRDQHGKRLLTIPGQIYLGDLLNQLWIGKFDNSYFAIRQPERTGDDWSALRNGTTLHTDGRIEKTVD